MVTNVDSFYVEIKISSTQREQLLPANPRRDVIQAPLYYKTMEFIKGGSVGG